MINVTYLTTKLCWDSSLFALFNTLLLTIIVVCPVQNTTISLKSHIILFS